MANTTRSKERTEFLRDIIICAVEGGVNEWACVSQYQYAHEDGSLSVVVGQKVEGIDETRATIHQLNDYETDYKMDESLEVTLDVVATGLGRLRRGEVGMNSRMLAAIKEADAENDAGQIDAYDASAIVQAGLFGELTYG